MYKLSEKLLEALNAIDTENSLLRVFIITNIEEVEFFIAEVGEDFIRGGHYGEGTDTIIPFSAIKQLDFG